MATTTSPQRIYVAKNNLELCIGCTYTLTPIVLPGTASQSVSYRSTDTSVASVDADGVIYANGYGIAEIYITSAVSSSVSTCVSVTVCDCGEDCDDHSEIIRVTRITLSCASTQTVLVGDTGTITATVTPSYATDTSVYWHSSDTSVITCTNAGKYTAKAEGTAVLTAYGADGAYATVVFTVQTMQTTIEVDESKLYLGINETYKISASVSPATASQSVNFSSVTPSIVSVATDGTVTAKAYGQGLIKVSWAEDSTVCTYVAVCCCWEEIEIEVTGIQLSCSTPTRIPVGTTGKITATVIPANATNPLVAFSSTGDKLSCSSTGEYTALSAGEQTVTAKAVNGVEASVTFVVYDEDPVDTNLRQYIVRDDEVTATHSIGPNASGMIDLRDGTLKFSITDIAWDGYLMPVTIRHLYSSALKDKHFSNGNIEGLNLKDFSTMQTGLGWRLNGMVSLAEGTEEENGETITVYTFVDREGDIYKLYPTSDSNIYEDRVGAGVKLAIKANDEEEKLYVTIGNECYYQSDGNIFRIYDTTTGDVYKQQAAVDFTYTVNHNYRIGRIRDGNDREFVMNYTKNYLTGITAPDGNATAYTYSGELLTKITYPCGESLAFTYDDSNRVTTVSLQNANGESEYMLQYAYYGDMVAQITEYGADDTLGRTILYVYGENVTRIYTTEYDDDGNAESTAITTYLFDCSGELLDSYTDHNGYVQVSGTEDNFGTAESGETHSYERTSLNLLLGHGFDVQDDLQDWDKLDGDNTCEAEIIDDATSAAMHGKGFLKIYTWNNGLAGGWGVTQTHTLPAGEYTFSAYVRTFKSNAADSGIRLCVQAADGSGAESVKVHDTNNGYMRLFATFTSAEKQNVTVKILAHGNGTFFVDSAQLELGSAPTAYNAVKNGSFLHGTDGWNRLVDNIGSVVASPNMDALTGVLQVNRGVRYSDMPFQYVPIKSYKNTRTTYTLSGFAKRSQASATTDENIKFRLRACITYVGAESEEWQFEDHTVDFSQETDQWQYVSLSFTKKQFRTIENIAVCCEYFIDDETAAVGCGYALFDSVALTIGETEYNLTEQDFGAYNEHEDDENTCDIEEASDAFEEIKGEYNLTLSNTTYNADAFGTIYSLQMPNDDYIGYEKEVDARGNVTTYETDKDTSRVSKVIDRMGNIKGYDYDMAGNITYMCEYEEIADGIANPESYSSVEYTYDAFNELTAVKRDDGMTYHYTYNDFHKLESIGVGDNVPLVQYSYKSRNGALKTMTYANGHMVDYTYDRFGRPVRETWKNADKEITQDTKYTYDGNGNPVSVLDITNQIEYTYVYENGRLICEMQSEGAYIDANSFKHPGTLKRRTVYRYNSKGEVIEKTFYDADGSITDQYAYTEDGNATVTLPTGAKTRSRSDKLGRQEFDEVQTGSGAFSRTFAYVEGSIPDEYKEEGKVLSSPTTNLVERISYSDGDELEYTYDAEERITSVKGKYRSTYEYDCHGQLTGEIFTDSDGSTATTAVEYDSAGNITVKDGKKYKYEHDSDWNDLLTEYDGKKIKYDALGNPTTYLGNTLTWTTGRKLQNFGDTTYQYNSLGQRICKTVGVTEHAYFYEGTRLIKEVCSEWDGTKHTIVFLYDASESPIGMQYDGTAYYYKKNLQGDVIALLNAAGDTLAEYIYDAWGALRTIRADEDYETVVEANPIRYRGYYYDTDTNLYFLQSRYYDPVVGRFINADDVEYTKLTTDFSVINLYAYCFNDPVNESDQDGALLFTICKKIVLGLIQGLLKQLCIDIVEWWVKYKYYGQEDAKLDPNPKDYAVSILSEILDEFNVSSIGIDWFWIVVEYVPRIIRGDVNKEFWLSLLVDVAKIYLMKFFSTSKTELGDQLKLLKKTKKKVSKIERNSVKIVQSYKKLGIKICNISLEVIVPLNLQIVSSIISIIYDIYGLE